MLLHATLPPPHTPTPIPTTPHPNTPLVTSQGGVGLTWQCVKMVLIYSDGSQYFFGPAAGGLAPAVAGQGRGGAVRLVRRAEGAAEHG